MANRGPGRRPGRRFGLGGGGVTVWQFSSEFADKQRDRVERLSAWRSYGEIVDAVITTSVVVPRSVICGQRAQFAAAIEDGEEANRKIVDALVAKHLSAVAGSEEDRLRSLHASRSKVWVVQKRDPRLHPAITGKGPTPPTIDIRYQPWLDRLDHVVETSGRVRWLARGGVLAFHAGRGFELMGGWILDGQHWPDPEKNARSDQLHRYGFS